MRRWYVAKNDIYYSSYIGLEESPWYVFLIESIVMNICGVFPAIPFPKIKIKRDGDETNLRDWYGDTRQIFHLWICMPVTDWCWKHIKDMMIELPFFFLKDRFPDEFKDCDYEDAVEERKLHSELLSQVMKDLMANEEKDVELAIKKFLNAEK